MMCAGRFTTAIALCVTSLLLPSKSFAVSIIRLTGGESQSGLQSNGTTFNAGPIGTGLDFSGDFSSISDILSGATYTLSGVQGTNNPLSNGQLAQATHSGTIAVYGQSHELLLRGTIGNGAIATSGNSSTFSSQEVTFFEGSLGQRFLGAANLALNFEGLPSAHFETQVSFQNVFNGYTNGAVTGYTQVQTGTRQELGGYNHVQIGTEQVQVGTRQDFAGYQDRVVGQRLECLFYAGRGCVPVDDQGHILAQYIGKWLFLGSTPVPIPRYVPIVERVPYYNTIPIYASNPLYRDEPFYNTIPVYESRPIYAQVPTYTQVPIYTQLQTGWDWNSRFSNGVISGSSPVPEPGSLLLFSIGAIGLRLRRKLPYR